MSEDAKEKAEVAVNYYFAEIHNLLVKANEPLRLAIMLLSIATTLEHNIPEVIREQIAGNKALCERMAFMSIPVAGSNNTVN